MIIREEIDMEYEIKRLSPEIADEFFDFFDNRAFSDGSPFYPCYCNAYNMSKDRINEEFHKRSQEYGGGAEGWKRAIRESAEKMINSGELKGYLAFDGGKAVGWCNSNDRLNYYRVGEFDLSDFPDDKACDYCAEKGEIRSVVCFEISPEYRGKGMASALLGRVCEDAAADGYSYVEGYPAKDGGYMGMAFTGPLKMYEKLGFDVYMQTESLIIVRKKL